MPRERLSLKARALQWLAQREHSRPELKRKLMRAAREEQARRAEAHGAKDAPGSPGARPAWNAEDGQPGQLAPIGQHTGPAQHTEQAEQAEQAESCERCVEHLLDWLQQHRYLSETRFVESRVQARAARYGNLRIRQELAQHGLSLDETAAQQLRASEFERARAVWQRKFGAVPADARERVRQMRFLAQRGFSADTIRRVLGAGDDF